MSEGCRMTPPISGEDDRDSKLYKDLLSLTGDRDLSLRAKYWSDSESADKYHFDKDTNGEVKVESLLKHFDLSKEIDNGKMIAKIKQSMGTLKTDKITGETSNKVFISEQAAFDKAKEFNKNNPLSSSYVATYGRVPIGDNNRQSGFTVRIEKRDKLNSLDASNMEVNFELNNRIKDILTQHGIGIGGLNELDKRLHADGVTDFSSSVKNADGLLEIIRIAEGKRGQQALPEEFGHFIIESLEQHPLVSRLLNLLSRDNNFKTVLGDQFDNYDHLYNSDPTLLAKEAAGKLMHQGFLQAIKPEPSIFSNLLDRVIQYVKSFFSSKSSQSMGDKLATSIQSTESAFGQLAKDVLAGSMTQYMDIEAATKHTTKLFAVSDQIKTDRDLLKNIIDVEIKRLKIFEDRTNGQRFDDAQRVTLNKLESALANHKELDGIYSYLDDTVVHLQDVNKRYNDLRNLDGDNSINEMASVLRDAKNYIDSYPDLLKNINLAVQEANRDGSDRFKNKVEARYDDVIKLVDTLQNQYSELALPLLTKWLEPWVGDSLMVKWGKDKGKVRSLQEVLTSADKDIGFMDRWMNSMADSNNSMLRLMDHAVKMTKEEGRLEHLSLEKELKANKFILESRGEKNEDFMMEKDQDGKLTGRYISKIDTKRFSEDYKAFREYMSEKYGPLDSSNYTQATNERIAWEQSHADNLHNKLYPKESVYENQAFKNMNPAQKEHYEKTLAIKDKLDSYLPDKFRDQYKAIQIRKDLVERLKSNPSGSGKELWESIKDSIMRRADDVDLGTGAKRGAETDFNEKVVQFLPIYYTHMLEDTNAISTDVTSTMVAYAAMAIDFDKMNKVIDTLELGRDLARDMSVTKTKDGKPLVESIKSMGKRVENKITSRGENSRIMERLNDFFDMQVYGHYNKDQGSFKVFGKEIDVAKAASTLNRVTSFGVLGGNALSASSHIGRGIVQLGIDAIGKEFFDLKNVANADKNLALGLPEFLKNITSRNKTDKLSLFNELFDVMQDYDQHSRDLRMDRKGMASKLFSTNSAFFLNNAGVFWMQTRPSLALADSYRMKDASGVEHSLYESLEVKKMMHNGINTGATLGVKEGYTKLDGSEFTNKDITAFKLKAGKITNKMFGSYNKADMNAFQHNAVGRLVSMFRKFMVQSYNRRFEGHNFDYDIQGEQEGYYATSANFIKGLYEDVKAGQFHLATHWNELEPQERMNIMKSAAEVGTFVILSTALGLITFSTDKDRPWLAKMLEYDMKRLHLEMGSMMPLNTQFPKEIMKLLSSPASSISYINKILALTNFSSYGHVLESGKYKGHSTLFRNAAEAFPMVNAIEKSINPDYGITWFNNIK